MKKSRLFFVLVPLLSLPGCWRHKAVAPTPQQPHVVESTPAPAVPQPPKKVSFSSTMLFNRKSDGSLTPKPIAEIVNTLESRVSSSTYLAAAQYVMLSKQFALDDKIALFKSMQSISSDGAIRDVLLFFETVLQENRDYLVLNPLTDINSSLISPSPDSSEFIKDHPEISSVIWTLDELYSKGNTLLQEAVRKNNVAAVRYLLAQGATPRYLDDPRGPVLSLEWADKHNFVEVAHCLAKNINSLLDTKTTLLDELLYQDPNAARLVQKYGGKTAVEILS